jgi:hypothetical protein
MSDPDDAVDYANRATVHFHKEILTTLAVADRAALDGCEIEAIRHAPTLQMALAMARSLASNSYHIESVGGDTLPATLPDWLKTLVPKRWRRWDWQKPRMVRCGVSIDMRHLCPHVGNNPRECVEFLAPPGMLHGEDTFKRGVRGGETSTSAPREAPGV